MTSLPQEPTIQEIIKQLYGNDELEKIMKWHGWEIEDATTLRHRMIEDANHDYDTIYEFRIKHASEVTEESIRALWRKVNSQPESEGAE